MATLGISTNTRLLGLAIINKGDLTEYSIRLYKSSWSPSKANLMITSLEPCVAQYCIKRVVLSIPPKHHQTKEYRHLVSCLSTYCKEKGIPFYPKSQEALRGFCNGSRRKTKKVVMQSIAERFPELTLPSARARLFWKAKVWLALAQARLILTVSDYSAREITEVLHVPSSRLRVAVEAPADVYRPSAASDVAAAAERVGLPSDARWMMYVGGFSPHKRVPAIVTAHGKLKAQLGDKTPHLLLVGKLSGDAFLSNHQDIREAISAAGTDALVHWTGFLSDDELRHLHTGSVALVLPSLAEGFGLPAVEAAACGCPVIATTASPLPELLAGGGIFVNPRDEVALAEAMMLLASDDALHARMSHMAKERADVLTWTHASRVTLSALEEAAR